MSLAEALKVAHPRQTDRAGLRELFDQFVRFNMPFETISNLRTGTLVKTAEQACRALLEGFGGHCLEHAILLRGLLAEAGFACRLVHADQHDFSARLTIELTQTYVLVDLGPDRVIVDPFLTARIYDCPRLGGYVAADTVVSAVPHAGAARMSWYRDGQIDREELVYLDQPEESREQLMQQRYATLLPFGVLAPFYREVRPDKRALFYYPAADKLLVKEGAGQVRHVPLDRLPDERWIPEFFRQATAAVLPMVRADRARHLAVLDRGLFNPYQKVITS